MSLNWNFTFFLEKHWKYNVILKRFRKNVTVGIFILITMFHCNNSLSNKDKSLCFFTHKPSWSTNMGNPFCQAIWIQNYNFNLIEWKGFTNRTKQFLCKIYLYYKLVHKHKGSNATDCPQICMFHPLEQMHKRISQLRWTTILLFNFCRLL